MDRAIGIVIMSLGGFAFGCHYGYAVKGNKHCKDGDEMAKRAPAAQPAYDTRGTMDEVDEIEALVMQIQLRCTPEQLKRVREKAGERLADEAARGPSYQARIDSLKADFLKKEMERKKPHRSNKSSSFGDEDGNSLPMVREVKIH